MKQKSLQITHIMIKAFYIILALVTIVPPFVYKGKIIEGDTITIYYFTLLAAVPAGAVALVSLDRLMINLRKKIVFHTDNVKRLRTLSWCCFFASFVTLASFIITLVWCLIGDWSDIMFGIVFGTVIYSPMLVMGVGEIFVGLVVRVVMHTFENAIEIKDENDLTI
ncbi:MAG: DUF2975 domain-containing protein [Eubacterium sp.]